MPLWFIALVSAEYLIAGVWLIVKKDYGLALFCLGCTAANIGLILRG